MKNSQETTMRCFLAADLPESVKAAIGAIQERLRRRIQGVRWTAPAGMHLTLKFFGNIASDDIASISDVVRKALIGLRPISLSIGNLGGFPSVKGPRVLWIGMSGDVDPLRRLQEVLDAGFQEDCGFEREKRPFKPHLTLGRAASMRGAMVGLAEVLKKNESWQAATVSVRGLTLFKSELKPGGAVYSELEKYSFGSAGLAPGTEEADESAR